MPTKTADMNENQISTKERPLRILIVDDEELIREMIRDVVLHEGFEATGARSAAEAKAAAEKSTYDLLITDVNMPGESGLDLARHFKKNHPATSVIIVTAFPDESRVKMMEELEVSSFLIKPFTVRQLRFSVLRAYESSKIAAANQRISTEIDDNRDIGLVGASPYIKNLRMQILLMAAGDFPVLVQGESGTGKEIIAHAIHENSPRCTERMITINCAAIPHHLEESEFFGHAKGAFTGANSKKLGIIESADHSTIFLDELGELSLGVQAKLLRVLDTGEFTRIGEITPNHVDIRIISATNRDLEGMIEEGTFRKDLFFRLKGARILTEPLANHRGDIPKLSRHFLNEYSPAKQISPDALAALRKRNWPGNIRELQHTIQHLATASRDQKAISGTIVSSVLGTDEPANETGELRSFAAAKEDFEKDFFKEALQRNFGNISRTAKEVGLHRPNLLRKLKELGLSADDFRS